MNLDKLARTVALASLVATSGAALAATDGTFGATSSGTAVLTMEVVDAAMITGLDDMDLGAYDGSADLTGTTAFCVYRNGVGTYDVTVTSANGGASFEAADGGNAVAYSVIYNDAAIPAGGTSVSSGVLAAGFSGDSAARDCGGSDNASMEVTFSQAALDAAPTGNYADTLTVLVAPN